MLLSFIIINFVLITIIFKYRQFICKNLNLISFASKDTFHKNKSYLLGGLIIYQGYILNYFYLSTYGEITYVNVILTSLFFLIALIDDITDISPYLKIFFCFFVCYFIILNDNTLSIKTINSLLFGILYFPENIFIIVFFPILCVVIFVNAFNFIDGINGLAASVGLSILFYIIFKNPFLLNDLLIILLSLIIFIYLSIKKSCFLGDSGNYVISITISIILIKENYLFPQSYYAEEIFVMMMVPGLDFIRLFFKRITDNKNPMYGDLNHLHHLMFYKFGQTRTLIYYLIFVNLPIYSYLLLKLNLIFIIFISLIIYIYLIKKLSVKIQKV